MSQPVGTLVKAMDILDALGEAAPIGVLDLSRRLNMDKSAVSRILTTFKTRGYVKVYENGQYDVGLRLFELGQTLQERMPVREVLIPHIDAIAHSSGETAFAMHYSHGQIAYLYDCVSTQDIRLGERRGMRAAPWHHPAGRAILAHRDEGEVVAQLKAARRETRAGLPTVKTLMRDFEEIRYQGFARQRKDDKLLISAPIHNEITNCADAALMLGGPEFRLPPSREASLANLLIDHAHQVSQTLGWLKPADPKVN